MSGIIDFFVPRETRFFDILKELSGRTQQGAGIFLEFIRDYENASDERKRRTLEQLKAAEIACDDITHRIAIELNQTFLTPIDREDIHRLSTLLDDVMDILHNIAQKMFLYNLKKIPKYAPELAAKAVECSEQVHLLVSKLGSKEKVSAHIRKIHELEREADTLRNEALAYLFRDSLPPTEIIKLKDLYELLEVASDVAEDIADLIEGIVIKYA